MNKPSVLILSILCCLTGLVRAQSPRLDEVAHYDGYIPYERLDNDIVMMKETGINVVRIAESTWSRVEPQDRTFDFSHIDRVLNPIYQVGKENNVVKV